MKETRVFEDPNAVQRYTAKVACAAAQMKYGDLNFWNYSGLTKRLSPARREGRWRKYTFTDVMTLACAQQLINAGFPARSAIHWALEIAHDMRRYDYQGRFVVSVEGDEQRAVFTPATKLGTGLPDEATVTIEVNVGRIAQMVRERLDAAMRASKASEDESKVA